MKVIQLAFGAKAQVVVGALCSLTGIIAWCYIEYRYGKQLGRDPLLSWIFRVSMFFGLVACYAIIATGLGYRATERVENIVVEHMDVDVEVEK